MQSKAVETSQQIPKRIGIVGLGDMGSGMAKNLLKKGYRVAGYDLRSQRLTQFEELGGRKTENNQQVGEQADTVFVMVLNGLQVREAILGESGLLQGLKPGSTIIITATINPAEVRDLAEPVQDRDINLIDSPVSGGKSGADNGTLTLMASGKRSVIDSQRDLLETIGQHIFHVGEEIGAGQTVKAALQALIGSSFTAIFESLVLGVKAGIDPQILYDVFSSSGVSSPLFKNCARLIMERKFKGTGSHIGTMYKDLGITMNLAREVGAAMFTTSAAYELFQAGISLFPDEDNWSIVKILEQIAGVEVKT